MPQETNPKPTPPPTPPPQQGPPPRPPRPIVETERRGWTIPPKK